ncbi:MAG: hypothetical protein ACTSW2_00570 [Alphaproteobacteria bacterium]
MKGFLIVAAFGLGLIGATISTAGTALAAGEGDRRVYDGYSAYNYVGALLYGSSHYYRQGHGYKQRRAHRQARRHGHRKQFTYSPKRRAHNHNTHNHNTMSYQAVRPCHATGKAGFDDYGRRVRIGGTMCYDAYGTPYIVKGSRHIIHNY